MINIKAIITIIVLFKLFPIILSPFFIFLICLVEGRESSLYYLLSRESWWVVIQRTTNDPGLLDSGL